MKLGFSIRKRPPPKVSKKRIRRRLRKSLRTKPYPYQVRGVCFLERYNGRVLIGDDMGLGKTLQSIGWAAIHPDIRPVVVVCPATIKFNWEREWLNHAGLKSRLIDGNYSTKDQEKKNTREKVVDLKLALQGKKKTAKGKIVKIKKITTREYKAKLKAYKTRVSKKLIAQKKTKSKIKRSNIIIINYDIVESWLPVLIELGIQILIFDECHYIKNRKAKRTKACRRLSMGVPHVIGLSGTPISGKPVEFFPMLQILRPNEFGSFWKYAFDYCKPKRNRFSGGWDFSGSSNLDDLRDKLKTIMIRRLKRKVLKDLPPKTRTVIPVEISNRKEYTEAERNFRVWLRDRKGQAAWDRASRAEAIVKLNSLKQLSAIGKLPVTTRWIRDFLETTTEKLVVFAVHKPIIAKLRNLFPYAQVVDGSVSGKIITRRDSKGKKYKTSKRQMAVDKFEKSKISAGKRRAGGSGILIGQLKAAGVGLNLTSANNVLFLELGWTPGEHDQAEDRTLRIGQKRKVSVYYIVGKDTVELRILEIIQEKDSTVSRILDGNKRGGAMKLLDSFLRKAS